MSQLQVPHANAPLFRPEAMEHRQTQWLGTVLLAPKTSHKLFALVGLLTAVGILCLLAFGEYTRTARINGLLVPQQGLLRIFAPAPGVITRLYVAEGSEVNQGAPLFELSTELQSEALGATQEQIARQLAIRRDSLLADRELQHQLHTQRGIDLSDRIAALGAEQGQLAREIEVQRSRQRFTEAFAKKQQDLLERGLTTDQNFQEAQDKLLSQTADLLALERTLATIRREQVTLQGEFNDLPLNYETKLAEIDRSIAMLEQELAEAEARRRIVVPAPQDGTVTALQAELGGRADSTVPLLAILPAGSGLEAQLFSPSRAIGFVRPGQRVLLRYQAYPYQKFGQYSGVVSRVSQAAVNPTDLGPGFAGLTSLFSTAEPVYRIVVALDSQTVNAYGKPVSLQPGMQLEASIVMETRSLFEWVFEPILTLTENLQ